ncbi:MAG: hypothetical protein E5Y88_28390 [Mesorhizobium sp.]|uniref:hypothetical protein n=1 Tax=Mesorhizobium sp. TaxID=1871066 RepID=UPI0011F7EA89|nr:hypothetical protein [Mesorhizobium sp.]TIL22312.1 MAG: hypothetical protein E5Y88_28390 [Mesorhizobium sp.]
MPDKTNAIFDQLAPVPGFRLSRERLNTSTGVTGRVLVLTANLDNLLYALLEAKMPALDKRTREALFEGTGSLGAFSSKIHLAKALGLIEPRLATELHKLRKIRNEFAHASGLLDWGHPKVAGLVSKLADAQPGKPSRSFFTKHAVNVRFFGGRSQTCQEIGHFAFFDTVH